MESKMLEVPDLASGNPQLQKAITKLVQAEQKVISKFDEKKAKIDGKLKLVKDFKTKASEAKDAIAPFRNPRDFKELLGESSHPDIMRVNSVDKNIAQVGSYDIEVVQMAMTNTISTYGFTDRDRAEVGVGYITFETEGGEKKEVYINSDNNTLDGVAATINAAKVGVKAMVVNDGSDADEPWRLIITGEKTGWKNNAHWPEFNLLDGDTDFDIDRNRDAQSAIIKLNGEPLMCDENKVKDLIPGVVFDLREAKPGQLIKLDIRPDYEKIQEKAKGMVDKLNAVLGFIQKQNQLDAKSQNDPEKALGGDVALKSIEGRMRNIIQHARDNMSNSEIQRLRDLGIVFNRSGLLDYDGQKFQQTLETKFDDVVQFFSGDGFVGGFGAELYGMLEGTIRKGDGFISVKEDGLQKRIDAVEKDKDRATTRAENRVQRARNQFARVESAIQEMQTFAGGAGGPAQLINSAAMG